MEQVEHGFLLVHKLLGFTTVLAIGPAALLVTIGSRAHRRLGLAYFVCMTVLYLSGSYFTFTQHELLGYKFLRNLSFNFFGYSLLVLAYLAVPLKRKHGVEATRLDRGLTIGLAVLSVAMLPLGIKRWPMALFGVIGLSLAWIDWQENKRGALSAADRLNRHIRYMMASYYYVVTLLSILLLPGSLKVKWAWPSAVALAVILLLTRPEVRQKLAWSRERATTVGLRFSTAVAFGLGVTLLYKLASEGVLFTR
jgi:uncharacterized membrane protein